MRKKIVAGNWKMHKNAEQTEDLLNELIAKIPTDTHVQVIVAPTFVNLASAVDHLEFTNIDVAAQNVHQAEAGAFTGEISAAMLKEIGVEYVVVGHSERRQYFAETDETVNKRTKAALAAGIIPIVCCGETLEEREANITEKIVGDQVKADLADLTAAEVASLVIAYEPVWAIGTGKTATDDQANEVCTFIRKTIADLFGQEAADKVRIQYGGSVKPATISNLMAKSDIDGALVGGASLKAEDFSQIVKF